MSLFSELISHETQPVLDRANHTPEADVPSVLKAVNAVRPGAAYQITESDLRAVEHAKVLYADHMLQQGVLDAVEKAVLPAVLPRVPDLPSEAS